MAVKALLIDDSASARQLIAHYLLQAGCEVAGEAANAADGLELFNKLRPQLVVLDLIMPEKDSIDSLTLIQTMKQAMSAVVIIVISAVVFAQVRDDALAKGAFAYLTKPLDDYAWAQIRLKLTQIFPDLL